MFSYIPWFFPDAVDKDEEYQRCFWARRPDGIVVDKEKEICYVLEFKRKMDRWMGYREEATDKATNQYASLMKGASKWTVHLVIIVGGMCGSVHTEKTEAILGAECAEAMVLHMSRRHTRVRFTWETTPAGWLQTWSSTQYMHFYMAERLWDTKVCSLWMSAASICAV